MNTPAPMDWTGLILTPAGPQEASLSYVLLSKLLENGHVHQDDLMKPGPGIVFDKLPYGWTNKSEHSGRREEKTVLPVWAHWLFCQAPRETGKATRFLASMLPAHIWVEPIFKNFSALDWVSHEDDHESMDQILALIDPETLKSKQTQAAAKDTASIHGQISPEMAQVLTKHGWDVGQKDRNGEAAIQSTLDSKLFITLLELGADPELARPRVSKVEERGQGRQAIIKLINEKSAGRAAGEGRGGNALHDEVARILESGVSYGFASKLSKLSREFPEGSPDGLLVGGRTPGVAMLDLASTMCQGDRLTVKARTFLALGEALLQEDGNGWVKLDQPARGLSQNQNLTDREVLLLGAIMLLAKANDNWTGGLSKCAIPPLMEKELVGAFPQISHLLAQVETLAPTGPGLGAILEQLSAPTKNKSPTRLDRVVSKWWDDVDCTNPVMDRLLATGWPPYSPSCPVEHLAGYEQDTWPGWLADKVTRLYERGCLSESWTKACASQWRSQAVDFLTEPYQSSRDSEMFEKLGWVTGIGLLTADMPQWKQWVHDVFEVRVPLSKIPYRFQTPEEIERVRHLDGKETPEVVIGEVVNPARWEMDGQSNEEVQATLIRRLALQLLSLDRGQNEVREGPRGSRL